MHAVSVGEVIAIAQALRKLREALPRTPVFVSTSTLAGRATADEKLKGLAEGVFYAPVDYVFAVRRVLRALRPSVVAIAETEIWPNLIREAKRTGAGVMIVNGRISDRALPRYRRYRWFFQGVLPQVDSILAQDETMRLRFTELGADPSRVRVGGNLKFDFEARAAASGSPVMQYLASVQPGRVWIAASTMPPAEAGDPDEDDAVLAAYRELARSRPDLALLLAPRKPERFEVAARKLDAAGIPYLKRSEWGRSPDLPMPAPRVLLLDTIGELSGLFAAADVVFMGGTLARRGGHNILEPAFFGKPIVAGPHMENFQTIGDDFSEAGAYVKIGGASELAGAVARLLDEPEWALEIGRKARRCAEAKRGATERAVADIRELYDAGVPRYRPPAPWFWAAHVLARFWDWGGAARRRRALARRRELDVPVISVGNLSMGGTGKTPCVLRLAALLRDGGRKPGILTRGYRRSSPHKRMALAPGAAVSSAVCGDEPKLFVQSGVAPVGVGSDRFETGRMLRSQFGVETILLDDGFQHARLARDVDIVLIDALEPFGRGGLFPLGRLREPLAALARADIVVITRSDYSGLGEAIESEVRRFSPTAPVFRAGLEAVEWVDCASGMRFDAAAPPFQKAGAFCGLANPQSFLKTLETLGVKPAAWLEFDDHHRYRPHELRRMAKHMREAGATAALTTAKDAVNLCEHACEVLAGLPVYWLRVEMRFDREAELLAEIERRLERSAVRPTQSASRP